MGSDSEPDPYPLPKRPLFSEHSGASTPPLQTTATVPFRWEEQPGKPRPCTDIIIATTIRSLELPPRLAMVESNKITKTSSPTTVLDGPTGKSVLSSSSFRFAKERCSKGQKQGSFDSNCSGGWSPNDESSGGGQPELVVEKTDRRNGGGGCRRFGSLRVKGGGRRDKGGAVVVSPSQASCSSETGFSGGKDGRTMRRNSSLSKVTRAHFWATIYEGFKHVVPWRKKHKKESFTL